MDSGTRSCVAAAASLSGLAFIALLVGVPLMINNIADLESELIGQRQTYMDTSNKMWRELMTQGQETQTARAIVAARQKRQYDAGATGSESSAKKNSCPPGPKGPPGPPGEPGMNGMDGLPGKPGDGAPVNAGGDENPYGGPSAPVHNPACGSCPSGPPGLPGYKGKRGLRGEKGSKGPQGTPGRDGVEGEEGPEGEAGHPGDIGPQGQKGPPGEDGIGYARGPPGPKGETGMPGAAGDEGLPGERGDDSPPGSQGEAGPQGPPGEKGKDGHPGLPGPAGSPGLDAEYCPCPERSGNGVAAAGDQSGYSGAAPKPAASVPAPVQKAYDESAAAPQPVNSSGAGPAQTASTPESDAAPGYAPASSSSAAPTDAAAATAQPHSVSPAGKPEEYQSAASRRFAAYSKLAHAVALRRRHL